MGMMLKEDLKKKILSKNNKLDLSKSALIYMFISLLIFSMAIFYTSSQIKHLIAVGNKFIVRSKAKTIVEKKYDFDNLEKLKQIKTFN